MRPVDNKGTFFQYVQGYNPGRSAFDMSYERHLTCKFGLLYPVWIQEALPGDHLTLGVDSVIRMQPTTAPGMVNIRAVFHSFFVPKRLVWKDFETFITRGKDGNKVVPHVTWPRIQRQTRLQSPTNPPIETINSEQIDTTAGQFLEEILGYVPNQSPLDIDQLFDHLELPPRINPTLLDTIDDTARRAYYLIWNDYYRDENLIDEIQNIDGNGTPDDNGISEACYYAHLQEDNNHLHIYRMQWLMPRAWKKDYFTSALPWPQRGTPPAIPLTGFASADFPQEIFHGIGTAGTFNAELGLMRTGGPGYTDGARLTVKSSSGTADSERLAKIFNATTIDLSKLGTFTIPDLRVAYSTQRFQELQARGGARYIETLQSQWGESPSDARLQRPEYIGGCKIPVVISEVVQTSESNRTPQGHMAGHGMSVSGEFIGTYKAEEYGWFIGLLSFECDTSYQQGIPREMSRMTTFEYVWPIFANLSEQGIKLKELWNPRRNDIPDTPDPDVIFGFQARFNECRVRQNVVTGQMRHYSNDDYTNGYVQQPAGGIIPASLSYWNFARYFSDVPKLNWHFMVSQPRLDNYLVQVEPPFIVQWSNNVKLVRKLSAQGTPGW